MMASASKQKNVTDLISKDPECAEVLFPYLNGDELSER